MVRRTVWCLLLAACVAAPLGAQDPAPPLAPLPAPLPQGAALDPTTAAALERLALVLVERRHDLEAATARGDAKAIAALVTELRQLRWQFAGLAARTNVQEFEAPEARQFDLRTELEELARPLVRMVKDATTNTRTREELKARIEALHERQRTAEAAQRAAERTRDLLPVGSAGRSEVERELGERWRPTIQSLRDEALVQEATLLRLEETQESLFDRIANELRKFVKNSGASLLLAVLVLLATLAALRWLVDRALRTGARDRSFTVRLLAIVLRALALGIAVIAALVVPYARDDWFLLALGVVFLVGAGWLAVRALPQFFEQFRLLLNVGGVREGERLVVDGLPYRVAALRFYTQLENPSLEGGVLRVPLQSLVGLRSRASGPGEPWFPTRAGDFVLLADGTWGAVRCQSPEVVVVEQGGAPRTFATTKFLELAPRNLSRGFTVDATLVVGRAQAGEITSSLRETLQARLAQAIAAVVPAEQVRSVRVLFQGVSKLGFELLALTACDGAAAAQYFELQRTMNRAFVDACREHGWQLPPPVYPSPAE